MSRHTTAEERGRVLELAREGHSLRAIALAVWGDPDKKDRVARIGAAEKAKLANVLERLDRGEDVSLRDLLTG